ncbi:MAG: hypothetical protein WBJ52_00215, partial [Methanoregulaceae archaeon]
VSFVSGNRVYSCVKYRDGEEVRYIFFCDDLACDQLTKKARKLKKDLEKGKFSQRRLNAEKIWDLW